MLNNLREQWSGSAWRWWSLGLGVLLTALAFGVGAVFHAVRASGGGSSNDGDGQALTGVLLITALLVASLIGSGMLESVTARTRSSTAAQPRGLERRLPQAGASAGADEPPPATVEEGRIRRRRRGPVLSDAEQARQDRRTIRAGLVALPLFLALMFLLLS